MNCSFLRKGRWFSKMSLCASAYRDPRRGFGDAFGEIHVPTADAVIDPQFKTGAGRQMVKRFLYNEEIRPHLLDAQRTAVDQQLHIHPGGMSAVI
jgi:hypothetical protein